MKDLVQKSPSGNTQRDVGTLDDTIAAVLATLNKIIKKHTEFSRFVEILIMYNISTLGLVAFVNMVKLFLF